MPNEPYRNLAQRLDSPSRHLTIEQRVDTRLCVSALTPQQCRELLMQLDDQQVKNAVYDRTLCFPFDQWTQNIRAIYGLQVQNAVQIATSFENLTNHMATMFSTWREVHQFDEHDFANIEGHIKGFVSPSIDNIGVYGTYSDHTATKINALAALLQVGEIVVGMPILTSGRGVAMFEYDPLSRAVANILSTATADATRRQILDPKLEGGFLELTKRAAAVGLFPGLLQALDPGAPVCPYNVPRGDLLIPYGNRPVSASHFVPMAKKRKLSQSGQSTSQNTLEKDGAATPRSSRGSSQQPRGVTEGLGSEPSTPRNPFSRPSSAGPVAMPPFAKAAYSTPTGHIKVENEYNMREQNQPGQQTVNQDAELPDIANGAAEYKPESQGVQQAANNAGGQSEQAEGSRETKNPGPEGEQPPTEDQPGEDGAQQPQPQPQAQQTEQMTGTEQQGPKPAYDDMLRQIENEVFHAHIKKTPEEQLEQAPTTNSLIEGTAGMILKMFQDATRACDMQGRRDIFVTSLYDTGFALLWILESCALNIGNTPLAAEVSRSVKRNALVGALWGSVRLASAKECLDLLNTKDHLGSETFGEKLERIIKLLEGTGVMGFGDLRLVLENMRSGMEFAPVQARPAQPGPPSTK